MCTAIQLLDLAEKYSGVLQTLILVGALVYTHIQIRRARTDREHANVAAISERVMTHNELILADMKKCKIVAECEGLKVPAGKEEDYWAARAVHLSHVNLLWQVWELAGRPGPGKSLPTQFAGWQDFARNVVAKPLAEASAKVTAKGSSPTPAEVAADDIRKGISSYEVTGGPFYAWLSSVGRITHA